MTKQKLKEYLQNAPLVDAIIAKAKVDAEKQSLCTALTALERCNCSDSTKQEVKDAIEKYKSISLHYSNLLQDAFGVTWHIERELRLYVNKESQL